MIRKRKNNIVTWVFLAVLFGSVSLCLGDAVSRKNAKGNKRFAEKKYEEAAKAYLDAQLESPKSSALHYNLGNANHKLKKYDKAAENYQKALETTDPGLEGKIRYNLGNTQYKLGEFEIGQGKQDGMDKWTQAIENYKRVLDLNPDDKDAKYNLEFVRRKLKEMAKKQPQDQNQQKQQNQKDQQDKEDQKKQQEQQQQQSQDSSQTEQQQQKKPGEMSKEEAQRLLDAYKDAEKDAKKKEKRQMPGRVYIEKDW